MILHIVLYQPKATASAEDLQSLSEAIEIASRTITSIRQVRVGKATDLGFGYKTWPYNQDSGYSVVLEFDNEASLGEYLAHDAHKVLANLFWKTCESPIILDVSAVDAKATGLSGLIG